MDVKNCKILVDCSASAKHRKNLIIGFSESSFHRRVNKLIEQGFLERNDDKYLTTKAGMDYISKLPERKMQEIKKYMVLLGLPVKDIDQQKSGSIAENEKETGEIGKNINYDSILDLNFLKLAEALKKNDINALKLQELLNVLKFMEDRNIDCNEFLTIVNGLDDKSIQSLINNLEKYKNLKNSIKTKFNYYNKLITDINELESDKEYLETDMVNYGVSPEQYREWLDLKKIIRENKIEMEELFDLIRDMIDIKKLGFNTKSAKIIAQQLSGNDEEIFNFVSDIRLISKDGEKLKNVIKEMENKIEKNKRELEETVNDRQIEAMEVEKLKKEKNVALDQLDNFKKILEENNRTIESSSTELSEWVRKKEKMIDDVEMISKDLNSLTNEYDNTKNTLENNKKENEKIIKNMEEIKQSYHETEQKIFTILGAGREYERRNQMAESLFNFLFSSKFVTNKDLIDKFKDLLSYCDGNEPDFRDPSIKISEEVRRDLRDYLVENLKAEVIATTEYNNIMELYNKNKVISDLQMKKIKFLTEENEKMKIKITDYEKK